MKANFFILFFVVFIISGCASTYKLSEVQLPTTKLDPFKSILISVPEDGWYENPQYRLSGKMTANAIRAAFAKKTSIVDVIDSCHGDECLKAISPIKYGYYVKPVILHWEERATEWSGKPDRIEIQVVIYDTGSKKVLATSSYTGKSKWATFGGDHPQDLLPKPTNQYINSLYQ